MPEKKKEPEKATALLDAGGKYQCARCFKTFYTGWSDDEAKTEAEANDLNVDDCEIVCDDCYKKIPWGGR